MQREGRSISPMFPRGLTTLAGRVQSIRNPDRPVSHGVSLSLRNQSLRIRGKSMRGHGNRMAITRCEPRFWILSSHGTTLQVDQATHTEAFADFAQLRAADREESAEQSIPAKLLDLNLPAPDATAQPLENPGQLGRNRRVSFPKKPAGVFDQLDIAPQRKAGNHAFTGRIQLATVFDRTKPQRLFQTGRRLRT